VRSHSGQLAVDVIEQKFDYETVPPPVADSVRELQQRVRRMEGVGLSEPLELLPALADDVTVRTGTACAVDSTGLALALAAGSSRAGSWVGVVGMPDVGWEAAEHLGLDLGRIVSVPAPGEHWLSVVAGLVDVTTVVVLRPPSRVSESQAGRIAARLRQRGSVLIVEGNWPRAAVSLTTLGNRWTGLGWGAGHLRSRDVTVRVRLGTAAQHTVSWGLPTSDGQVVRRPEAPAATPTVTPAASVAAPSAAPLAAPLTAPLTAMAG
jgi:hypothetical protein